MFVNSNQPTVPSETRRLTGLTRGCWEEGSQKRAIRNLLGGWRL